MLAGRKASQNRQLGTAKGRPKARYELLFSLFRALDLAGTETTGALGLLLLADGNNVDLEVVEAKGLEKVLGVGVNVELTRLGLGDIESGDLRNVLILALTLLLLKLEGDTADGTTLDALHQVGSVTSDLVAKTLGGNDGDLITDTLVGLEVEGQLGVVTLDDDLSRALDCLGTDATHFGGCWLAE